MNTRKRPKRRRKGARFTALLLALTLALGTVTAAFAEENEEEIAADVAEEAATEMAAETDEKDSIDTEEADTENASEDEGTVQEVSLDLDDEAEIMEYEPADSKAEESEIEMVEAISSTAGDSGSYIVSLGAKDALLTQSSEDTSSNSDSDLEELTTILESLVASAAALEDVYTSESQAVLDAALASAESVLSDDDATEEEISEALTSLSDAVNSLVRELWGSGTCGGNLTWTLGYGDGILTISGSGEMYDYANNAPWKSYQMYIRSIVIEEGVTSIGDHAFSNLWYNDPSVEIASSVVSIGDYAFDGSGLGEVTGGEGVTTIGDYAFSGASLDDFPFSEVLVSIGVAAFYSCDLSYIYLPDTVTYIGALAFAYNQYGDYTIYFAGNTPELGRESAAYSNVNYRYVTNILTNTEGYANATVSFDSSYDGWTEEYLADLNDGAECSFYDRATDNWVSVTTSSAADVTSGSCGEDLTWTWDNCILTISGTGEMYDYDEEVAPWYRYKNMTSSIVIEEGVTSIGNYAFEDLSDVISAEIPSSVVSMGEHAFDGCSHLVEVTGGEGVTTIRDYAFAYCSRLQEYPFSDVLVSVGDYAFYYGSLSYIYLADTINNIGTNAFALQDDFTIYFAGEAAKELGTTPLCELEWYDITAVVSYSSAFDGWTEEYLEALTEGANGYYYERATETLVSFSSSSDSDSDLEELAAELRAFIASALYLEGSYTSESLAMLQAALAAAETVLSNEAATEEEISAALTALNAALASLVEDTTESTTAASATTSSGATEESSTTDSGSTSAAVGTTITSDSASTSEATGTTTTSDSASTSVTAGTTTTSDSTSTTAESMSTANSTTTASTTSESTQTGDGSNLMLYAILMMVALGASVGAAAVMKKRF